ncbi:iron-sulfur cluster assembly scaffold protein [Photobacterium sanctipauli]|uniref:Iron-sulfur cluster assembly scaffold protein n=1 Tax=Photobacterium sanctipauli TaxID=1342794 RepID=A0A2T3P169_9GAMM|nr:iron-sulfur cluster assembly scaffold protein [Photobacterium sanctipauli]PSW22266.1 iron-sulfur cluster assembly scaffold protein [Photobacterium sanctipauli]
MYNDIIIDNFTHPQFSGELASPDFTFMVGNAVCGDRIEIALATENGLITEAKFQAWGCATSVATANIFCSNINGKSFQNVQQIAATDIAPMLGELEPAQQHCIAILEALFEQYLQTACNHQQTIKTEHAEARHVSAS